MTKERELLARAGLVIAQYRWSNPAKYTALHKLSQTINEYLEENPQDEPIAYWDTQNGTLTPAVPLSSERTCFKVPLVPLYLHPRADIADELVEALEELMYARTDKAESMAEAALAKLE
jgi:hypothetical protein